MQITKKMLLVITLLLGSFSAHSATASRDNIPSIGTVSADTQSKGTERDVELTRSLRAAIMADNQLSTSAHNIKIVTDATTITLRGPVKTSEEKMKIEKIAQKVASNLTVENDLEIKQ